MNTKTGYLFALTLTAALAAGAVQAAPATATPPDMLHGLDREQLRAALADYGLPPARALARDIARDIVAAQDSDAYYRDAYVAARSVLRPREAEGRSLLPAVTAGESAGRDREKAHGGILARLRDGLRKLAEFLPRERGTAGRGSLGGREAPPSRPAG